MGYPWKQGDDLTASDLNQAIANNAGVAGISTVVATGSTTARKVADRFADQINVKDYGAKLDGVTNDVPALQAAYNAAPNNGTIVVPGGGLASASFTSTPGKSVLWDFIEALNWQTGSVPVGAIGDGDVIEGMIAGRKVFTKQLTNSNNGYATAQVGVTNQTGGSVFPNGYVVTGLLATATSAANNSGYTWAFNAGLTAGSTGGNNSQDGAIGAAVTRTGAGATWQFAGQTTDITGLSPNSPSAIVGVELDITCNGPDSGTTYNPTSGASRAFFNCFAHSYQPPVWTAGASVLVGAVVQPTSANGYTYVCTVSGTAGGTQPTWPTTIGNTVSDGTVTWKCGTTIPARVAGGVSVNADSGVQLGAVLASNATVYDALIEFSGAALNDTTCAAIRLAANMPIDFSGNLTSAGQNVRTLKYNSTSGNLEYSKSGAAVVSVTDSGGASVAGLGVNGAAGTANGLHFGSTLGSSGTDVSKHIDLYGGNNGFGVSSGQLNVVLSGTNVGYWTSSGYVASQINMNSTSGPNIRAGTGAASGTQPAGSLWLRTDGSTGSRLYVSAGGGTWNPVAGV